MQGVEPGFPPSGDLAGRGYVDFIRRGRCFEFFLDGIVFSGSGARES